MRRFVVVFSVALAASFVSCFAAFSAGAQPSSAQQGAANPVQEPRGGSPQKASEERASGEAASGAKVQPPPARPYFQLVDDSATSRFRAQGWEDRPANDETFGDSFAQPSGNAGQASFEVKVPKTGLYTVYARWPVAKTNTTRARFSVPTTSGTEYEDVDQRNEGGFWIIVGAYKMEKGERVIRLDKAPTAAGQAVADAVMVVQDAAAGKGGEVASFADPDALAAQTSLGGSQQSGEATRSSEPTLSTRSLSSPRRVDIVRISRRHKGTPYRNDVCRNGVGEDCSCHTSLVYRAFGYRLPDSPVYQWRARVGGIRIYHPSDLVLGDLVFHDLNRDGALDDHYADHVEIYSGNGYVIHASSYFGAVVEKQMKYLPGFWGGRRLAIR